jgi:hypothetical protein
MARVYSEIMAFCSKPKLVQDLKLRAQAEDRSVSAIIRLALAEYLYR